MMEVLRGKRERGLHRTLLFSFLRAEGGRRRGYMGHLTRIANSIVHNSDKGPNGVQIQQLISGLPVYANGY